MSSRRNWFFGSSLRNLLHFFMAELTSLGNCFFPLQCGTDSLGNSFPSLFLNYRGGADFGGTFCGMSCNQIQLKLNLFCKLTKLWIEITWGKSRSFWIGFAAFLEIGFREIASGTTCACAWPPIAKPQTEAPNNCEVCARSATVKVDTTGFYSPQTWVTKTYDPQAKSQDAGSAHPFESSWAICWLLVVAIKSSSFAPASSANALWVLTSLVQGQWWHVWFANQFLQMAEAFESSVV